MAELKANNFDQPQVDVGKASTSETASRASAHQQSEQDKAINYQDVSQPTTSLAIGKNVVEGFAFEYAGAKALTLAKSLFTAGEAGRVFWSGGEVAKTAAADFAKENAMKTLEMTTAGRAMNAVSPYLPRSVSSPIWDGLSRNFARGAAGEVNVFQNAAGVSIKSTWKRIEYPILQNNKMIFHIVNW